MEEAVARVEPAKRRQHRKRAGAELSARGRKKVGDRSNAAGPDESVDLDPKRNECDQKNQTERAEKPSARPKIFRRPDIFSPKQFGQRGKERPIEIGRASCRERV